MSCEHPRTLIDMRMDEHSPLSHQNTPQNFGFLCYIQLVFAFARLFKLSVLVQEVLDELRRIKNLFHIQGIFSLHFALR